MRQASITIHKAALQHNLQRVKQLAPKAKTICMVKANAYGLGVENAIHALDQADAFGVACLQEALEIRATGNHKPITLIEGVFSETELLTAIKEKCECIIHHRQQLDWLLHHKTAYQNAGLKVWIKLNSGMNRLGFKVPEIINVIHQLKDENFHCVLAMHFANADVPEHPMNQQQIDQLLHVKAVCEPIEVSCCNSAAIYNYPELHFDYVRPGIMLYGASPFDDRSAKDLGLQTTMTFTAGVMAINRIKAGEKVGYGSRFIAEKDISIAVVSIGYGDGYPRAYQVPVFVAINGQRFAHAGRVSMDMMTIDITGYEDQIHPGTSVELWGEHISVDEVAAANGTIGYELLCRLTERPKRIIQD
ncbi:alanine racemase [Acinetobacter qingfengensis]|uniref:Alanine racemase n=1 Tax=Acinetobacter qingfengensis TaxID=1262585 RepID=A0A1E7RE94_9GAMM|nr:alanine racemase [Acinetobacter qingfengensis]KAA8735017.1 alanine racemase [Acinetobacter qingfengensis]OEY97739.1 alanine racemase [Acinetobacter qingfengensis]